MCFLSSVRVAGDRLVAELGQLDPHLGGGDAVGPVADHRPVALGRRQPVGGLGDGRRAGRAPRPSRRAGSRSAASSAWSTWPPTSSAIAAASSRPGGDLAVERLGRRHRHLDVAAVGRVQHPVGLVGEVAAPPVDDGDDLGAPGPDEVDRAVGVGGGARLADGDDQRVGHRRPQPEARQLGGGQGVDPQVGLGRRTGRGPAASAWPATAAVPWPITSTRSMAPERRPARTSSGSVSGPRPTASPPSRSTSLPRSVLRKLAGDSVISLSRKCGNSPRSMSRVVIWAPAMSPSVTGSGVPS